MSNREALSHAIVALSSARAAYEHARDAQNRLAFITINNPAITECNRVALNAEMSTHILVSELSKLVEQLEEDNN